MEKLLGHSVGDAQQRVAPEPGTAIALMSAAGRLFTQETARRYAKLERLILICGRYEGVDERVAEHLATEEICVGDYVLSGGELPAAIVLDAVTRLLPGALGNEASTENESFSGSGEWRVAEWRASRPANSKRVVGFSSLHPARRISRLESPRCADRRQPRGGSQMAKTARQSRKPGEIGRIC